jgi:ABC-type antimicrobial peptide transport system permease subunit
VSYPWWRWSFEWRRHVHYIPFIGRLPDCSGKDLVQAAIEVGIATLFSTMPLWFLRVVGPMFLKSTPASDAMQTGELFLFSTTLVGPLVYIITKNYGEIDHTGQHSLLSYRISFPYGFLFVLFSVLMCLTSSVAFTILRNPLFDKSQLDSIINYDSVINVSWWIFWLSILIFFCATAYRNSIEHIGETMRGSERDFAREWESRK